MANRRRETTLLIFTLALASSSFAQSPAQIRLEKTEIQTYGYSDPNPVPILVKDTRLYPYHSFDGMSAEPEPRTWDVVVLENDYIKVFVLPEAGGKIWGAIEKSTGNEFIYRNEVMKFRNIALRGPWTSGGIEFNFGVIGHTPSTAAPVDYVTVVNADGSVSCFVGTIDLPSRTEWRVEIRLSPDKAYVETRALWSNPTPVEQPYYNWMTAAAFATDDLVMSIPGNSYLGHSGEAMAWPVDSEGRDLAVYDNNRFGRSKSYHVVGKYADYFGGYYKDQGYGFGHWAEYSDMPGQKLWLWSLARDGGIWEDLLTDTDGQYIEFQAGRLFVQYSPGANRNPITQVGFEPYRTDRWVERWFPVMGIGGLVDASSEAAMNVEVDAQGDDERVRIGISPFGSGTANVSVKQAGREVGRQEIQFDPLQVTELSFPIRGGEAFEVIVPELDLGYHSDPAHGVVERPFVQRASAAVEIPPVQQQYQAARELMKGRWYTSARVRLDSVLVEQPWHTDATLAMAELDYRSAKYVEAMRRVRRVLELDTYHARANYLAGIINRASGKSLEAKEALGWAARSMAFRSVAFAQLAEVAIQDRDYQRAIETANAALDYDRYSIPALETLAAARRLIGDADGAAEAIQALQAVDPLSKFAAFERYLADRSLEAGFFGSIRSEFPEQSYVELGLSYRRRGMDAEALEVFSLAVEQTGGQLSRLWLAYLLNSVDPANSKVQLNRAIGRTVEARPYRQETIDVLEWAVKNNDNWQWRYLLALNYWAVNRDQEAANVLTSLADMPDEPEPYITRAMLRQKVHSISPERDYRKALSINENNWRSWLYLERYLEDAGRWDEAWAVATRAVQRFPESFVVRLAHARTLIRTGRSSKALEVLGETNVLPAEGSGGGRELFAVAHMLVGLDLIQGKNDDCEAAIGHFRQALLWPEHLGQGKPFVAEERLQNMMTGFCLSQLGRGAEAERAYESVADVALSGVLSPFDYLNYLALARLGLRQRAEELLRAIRGRSGGGDVADWIVARASGDRQAAERIRARNAEVFGGMNQLVFDKVLQVIDL